MFARLLRDYAQSSSYWRRCCFVHACSGFLTVFSAKFVQVRCSICTFSSLESCHRPVSHKLKLMCAGSTA